MKDWPVKPPRMFHEAPKTAHISTMIIKWTKNGEDTIHGAVKRRSTARAITIFFMIYPLQKVRRV
jgi:hypothetical protein